MTINKKQQLKKRGIIMLVIFFTVLAVIFTPIFPGKANGLDYMDNLFNMISKGSSDFIAEQRQENSKFKNTELELQFTVDNKEQAEELVKQLTLAGVMANITEGKIAIKGNMAAIVDASLADCRAMFDNNDSQLQKNYNFSGKKALFNWWTGYKAMLDVLNKEKKFKEAKFFGTLRKKAIEPAYNYFGIEAKPWRANILMIVFSLTFYVVYTVWYGFGILYLFEGLGLKIGH